MLAWSYTLQWRHNGHDSGSNHQPHDCLLKRLFRRRSKNTSSLRVTGLCAGNSPGTGEFPAQMASNAENVSIWWRHHDIRLLASLSQFHLSDFCLVVFTVAPLTHADVCHIVDLRLSMCLFWCFNYIKKKERKKDHPNFVKGCSKINECTCTHSVLCGIIYGVRDTLTVHMISRIAAVVYAMVA